MFGNATRNYMAPWNFSSAVRKFDSNTLLKIGMIQILYNKLNLPGIRKVVLVGVRELQLSDLTVK